MSFDLISINHFLVLSALIFAMGVFGIFYNRKNIFSIFISIELLLLATQINLVAFSTYLEDISGQILSIFALIVTVAEVAIGLAIIITLFRNKKTINTEEFNILKG